MCTRLLVPTASSKWFTVGREELMRCFVMREPIDGLTINTIQHEDGSGVSYNLTFSDGRSAYLRVSPCRNSFVFLPTGCI
jgi:hypothetical protein